MGAMEIPHSFHFIHNDDATAALAFVRPGQAKADYLQWVDWIMDTPVDTYAAHAASPFECFYPTAVGGVYVVRAERRSQETVGDHQGLPDHMYYEVDLAAAPALGFRNELDITALALPHEPRLERVLSVLEVWAG